MYSLIKYLIFFIVLTSLQLSAQQIYVDKLDNVYVVQQDKILKYDSKGILQYEASFKKYGTVTSLDVSDPFKIMVFFGDFARIVFLDNTLNANQGSYSLYSKDIINPSLVCSADDKSLWIYDKQLYSLIKTNENLQQLLRITDMQVIIGTDFEPVCMRQQNNYLFLSDPLQGIFIFDKYGSLLKTLHYKNIEHFEVDDNYIYFAENNEIKIISHTLFEEYSIPLKELMPLVFAVRGGFIYILNRSDFTYTKEKLSFK